MAWLGLENRISWESSASLTSTLIDDFEKGIICKDIVVTDKRFGATSHILSVTSDVEEPSAKRANTSAIDFAPG